MSDAGPDWPAGIKAVAFVETATPTLLRERPSEIRTLPRAAPRGLKRRPDGFFGRNSNSAPVAPAREW